MDRLHALKTIKSNLEVLGVNALDEDYLIDWQDDGVGYQALKLVMQLIADEEGTALEPSFTNTLERIWQGE